MTIKDSPKKYGTISRMFHWIMALLILWQFLSAGAHYFLEDTAIESFFWPSHKPLGVVLLAMVFLRLLWASINLMKRPHSINLLAKLGHITLYLLLIFVPITAMIRQYGSGRSFDVLGVPIFSGFDGERIQWMLDMGSDFHGEAGWILLLLIVGHVFMAVRSKNNAAKINVMPRMWK